MKRCYVIMVFSISLPLKSSIQQTRLHSHSHVEFPKNGYPSSRFRLDQKLIKIQHQIKDTCAIHFKIDKKNLLFEIEEDSTIRNIREFKSVAKKVKSILYTRFDCIRKDLDLIKTSNTAICLLLIFYFLVISRTVRPTIPFRVWELMVQ